MLGTLRLDYMTRNRTLRPDPGRAIAARRKYLGKTADQIDEETGHVIYRKLLSHIENGKKSVASLPNNKLRALIRVLEWTNAEFEHETGVNVGYDPEPLPTATPFNDTLQVPIYESVSAGLASATVETEVKGYMGLDPNLPGLRGRPGASLVTLPVNGSSMVSPKAHETIPGGSVVVVELGAIPQQDDVVVAWVEDMSIPVLKKFNEGPDVVLSSYNPRGPVFRASEIDFDVRGVVRLIIRKP